MDIFSELAKKIIIVQESIIGPLAIEQARKVQGLTLEWQKHEVLIKGNQKEILENLVEKYKDLFGQASVEVCRDAAKDLLSKIPQDQIPNSLK